MYSAPERLAQMEREFGPTIRLECNGQVTNARLGCPSQGFGICAGTGPRALPLGYLGSDLWSLG